MIMDFENKNRKIKFCCIVYLIFWSSGGDGVKKRGKGEESVLVGTRVQITNAVQSINSLERSQKR